MTHYPFFVLHKGQLKKVDPLKIAYLQAEGNYTRMLLADKTFYHVRSTLSDVMKKLPDDIFIRVHRSLAVSMFFMDDISTDHLIVCGKPFPVGKRYYNDMISRLTVIA